MVHRLTEQDKALLVEARRLISEEQEHTVCCAISEAAEVLAEGRSTLVLRQAISAAMGCQLYVTTWLRRNHNQFLMQLQEAYPGEEWQQVYRLAWIDHMLEKGEV